MWLLTWVGTVLLVGALGGMLGALAERSAKPGVTPLSEFVSAFFAGRADDRDTVAPRPRAKGRRHHQGWITRSGGHRS